MTWTQRVVSAACIGLLAGAACGGSEKDPRGPKRDPEVVRYRLLLRENPVDSGEAFRCYGACQPEETPTGYLSCLQACPGFEVTHGVTCAGYEVPPVAACFTARKVPRDEIDPGYVVLLLMAEVAVVVALSSVCASTSNAQCGSDWASPPGSTPVNQRPW